jgi:flavin-binding protein dodecin
VKAAGPNARPARTGLPRRTGRRKLARAAFRGLEVSAMSSHVYKHLELTGSSPDGVEAAIRNAIAKANETVRNIQWFEVVETRGHVKDGEVAHWQVTLKLGFTLE